MKNLCIAALVAMATISGLTGCATGNMSLANESAATIQQKIVKGKTTKADLRAAYGEPSETGIDAGNEYWGYQMAETSAMGMVPFANMVTGSNGITSRYLRITFDKKGLVETYSLSQTKL